MTTSTREVTQTSDTQDPKPPWRVRYTWRSRAGTVHPEHTFAAFHGETRAIDTAVSMIDNHGNQGLDPYLVRADISHDGGAWRKIH